MALVPLVVSAVDSDNDIDQSIARHQKAVTHASQPIHQLERLGWAFVAKARESRDSGYYKLAEQAADCIDTKAADTPESLLLRGHVLHNLHRFNEAETLARSAVEQRGLWFDYALLGDVLMERGAINEAIDAYQEVIDKRPGPQAYARIARLRWIKGDLDGAVEMMAAAVRATSPRTPEPAAWAHVQLARLLMQVGKLANADALLDRALTLHFNYPPALHMRGRLRLAQGKLLDAVPLLKRAVQADPLPEFRWTLYEALRLAGQDNAAGKQKAALHQHGESEDRRTLALFLTTLGDAPENALRLALRELEIRADVFTLDAVAWAYSGAGKNKRALAYSRRALAEGTQDARLLLHAGVIAARAGAGLQAITHLAHAQALQQMLLPSERQQLANEFAALQPRIPTLANAEIPRQDDLVVSDRREL
jgi:tetratricopeptide (TPR) repeat protein